MYRFIASKCNFWYDLLLALFATQFAGFLPILVLTVTIDPSLEDLKALGPCALVAGYFSMIIVTQSSLFHLVSSGNPSSVFTVTRLSSANSRRFLDI